jgi:hypothetical protein
VRGRGILGSSTIHASLSTIAVNASVGKGSERG